MVTREQLIREWIEALRSGNYKQGRCYLNRNDEYCCLGVLCEVYQKHDPAFPVKPMLSPDYSTLFLYGKDQNNGGLPVEVMKAIGMNDQLGVFEGGSLTSMNDMEIPFEEIANVIESKPTGLFKEPSEEK